MLKFYICSTKPKLLEVKFGRKHIKFGDSSYNRMKVIVNLKFRMAAIRHVLFLYLQNIAYTIETKL